MSEIIGKSFDGDDMRIPLSDVARFLNDAGVEIDPATTQPATRGSSRWVEYRDRTLSVIGSKGSACCCG